MANEDQIQRINETLRQVKADTVFNEVKEKHQNLQDKKQEFNDLKDEAEKLIKKEINRLAEDDKNSKGVATYSSKITVKNDEIYSYGNGYTQQFRHIVNENKNTRRVLEANIPGVTELLDLGQELRNQRFDDDQLKGKKLLPDVNSEFDAVTFYLKSGKCGIKLVDSLGTGSSCSRTRVNFDSNNLDHLTKVLEHIPHIEEVIEQVEGNVDEVVEQRREKLEEIKKHVGVEQ